MIKPLDNIDNNLNKEIELEERKEAIIERRWKSCCFEIHSESAQFFAKIWISTLAISLCSYQLITLVDCSYQSLYSSVLSSVLTYWLSNKK